MRSEIMFFIFTSEATSLLSSFNRNAAKEPTSISGTNKLMLLPPLFLSLPLDNLPQLNATPTGAVTPITNALLFSFSFGKYSIPPKGPMKAFIEMLKLVSLLIDELPTGRTAAWIAFLTSSNS